MADSVSEMLREEMECEGLFECFHGLKPLDERCFRAIAAYDAPLTVDEVAEAVDRERSTTYRSIQRLLASGLVQKEQRNYDGGGYYHVYRAAAAEEITDEMQAMLNAWYAKIGQLLQEFEEKYDSIDADRYGDTDQAST